MHTARENYARQVIEEPVKSLGFFLSEILFHVFVCLPECMSVYHTYAVPCRNQKRVSDPQRLELELVVCYHLNARNCGSYEEQPVFLTIKS